MKSFKLILSLFLLIFSNQSYSANTITIVVLKGKATIENKTIKSIVPRTKKSEVPSSASVVLNPNSSVIIYNSKSKLDLSNTTEISYTYSQLNSMLNKVKPGSLTTDFINYLDKMYANIENNNNSFGATIGAVSRGSKNENITTSPADESIILSDTVELIIGDSNTVLLSDITIKEDSTLTSTTFKAVNNSVVIFGLKPGHYTWEYKVNSSEGPIMIPNTFIIPNNKLKNEKLKLIQDLLNNCCNNISKENKEILEKDFLEMNNLYIHKK